MLTNHEKLMEAGIAEDTVVTVVFKPDTVICSNQNGIVSLGLGGIDSEFLLVEVPNGEANS